MLTIELIAATLVPVVVSILIAPEHAISHSPTNIKPKICTWL